jgi:hypothetical protein
MKSLFTNKQKVILAFALTLTFSACEMAGDPVEPSLISPDAEDITGFLRNLSADTNDLLNVQSISGSSQRIEAGKSNKSTSLSGGTEVCTTIKYDLLNNFEEVAILRPTSGIIYPGALVIADKATLGGLPTPAAVDRAPMTLRIDLPGMGENGTLKVDKPSDFSVAEKIDEALEWWNANAYEEGYVNASNSSFVAKTAYSSRQVSMDLSMNVEWARGDVAAQFNFSQDKTSSTAMMVFKQVFYTITMTPPTSPGGFFGPEASISEIEQKFGPDSPPAYVQSVNYGRIIMFRMTTTTSATEAELEGSLNYAAGKIKPTDISATVEAKYKKILETSNVTVVTIGGNAEVASEAVSARNFADLEPIIKGKNAVYSRDNPGVPISYKLHFVKDNTTAKLGYTTSFEVENCDVNLHPAKDVRLLNNAGTIAAPNVRYSITHKTRGKSGTSTINSGNIGFRKSITKAVPAGAYDINVKIEFWDITWKTIREYQYSKPTKVCYETFKPTIFQIDVKTVGC